MTPLDGPVRWFLLTVLVVSLLAGLVLELRDHRRRRAAQAIYARGLGLVAMPRRVRRSRRRWARW